MSGRDRDVPRT